MIPQPPEISLPSTRAEVEELLAGLRALAEVATSDAEIRELTSRIARINRAYRVQHGIGIPRDPIAQAKELEPRFVARPHLTHLSERLVHAVREMERGKNQFMAVSMPPRAGKSTLLSQFSPLWMLRRHPEWKIISTSYDAGLSTQWTRNIRTYIEHNPDLGIALAKDGGAGGRWSTVEGGGMLASSVRGSLTGRGARVFIIDDPVKDFVEAHSPTVRQSLWDWWLSVAQTRLEPPYLVLVVMTRWHEDDFVGRLFSDDHEGDPKLWERISLPALADRKTDPLGRAEGDPLLSPLLEEDRNQAIDRWLDVKRAVGSYTFSAMYQQRPAPAKGAIFDANWWRFWSWDPEKATADGKVVWLDPSAFGSATWLDSWDMAFKGTDTSDWVVGQRWMRERANRYLIAQQRGRWTFTQSVARMERWADEPDQALNPHGHFVHKVLVEAKANGEAILDVLHDKISGLKPISPKTSKESRAHAVTPECESGNVYLPHPSDPGNEWVADLLSELRNFPHDANDDQVDCLTQALGELRSVQKGGVSVPGSTATGQQWAGPGRRTAAAVTDINRRRTSAFPRPGPRGRQ